MKKTLYTAVIAAALISVPQINAAESAEAILKKHVGAIGGEAAFKKTKSREMVAVLDIPAVGMSASMKIIGKAPNKMRTELDIPGMGKVVEAFDGKVAWSQNPAIGLLEKEGDQLAQAKRQADFYRDVEIASRFEKWTVKGKETVEGKETWVLIGSSAGGDTETMYIDAKTYLLSKIIAKAETPNGTMDASTVLSDYRAVSGLKFPHKVKIQSPMGEMSMTIKSIKFNVDAPDSLFAKPTN